MVLNKFIKAACLSACLGLASGSILASGNYNLETNGGLKVYDENNNDHWFRLSGKVKFDQTFYFNTESDSKFKSNANLRSVEASLSGGLGRDTSYNMKFTTNAKNILSLNSATVNYTGFNSWSKVSLGEVKSPYGAANASGAANSFLEQSLVSAFNPQSGLGVSVDAWTDQVGMRMAITQPQQKSDKSGSDLLTSSLRLSFAPVNSDNLVFHLGCSAQLMTNEKEKFEKKYNTHLEARGKGEKASHDLVETDVKNLRGFALDAAMQKGPLFLQAELHRADLQKETEKVIVVRGYNIQATYALTGESRNYNYQTGGFSGINPSNDSGSWEISFRNSYLDLQKMSGDKKEDQKEYSRNLGASVAWTASNNLKVLANYIHTHSGIEDNNNLGAFAVRLQASW